MVDTQAELNQGNWINSYWGPLLTPYARAICAKYRRVWPFYITVPTQLTNTVREERQVYTDPFLNDCLIIAGHTEIGNADNGDSGQQVFMQVSDLRSGLMWSTPGPIDCSPTTAYGGALNKPMPVELLPEAFFLPAHVRLKHLFKVIGSLATGGTFTWLGLQLIDPIDGQSPEHVQMPDGSVIRVGQRMPWFSTIGMGTEISVLGSPNFVLGAGNFYSQYFPPMDCDVEIHSIHANWFTQADVDQSPAGVLIGLADKGQPQMWMPSRAPASQIMSDFNSAYPALPFAKPYLLKAGDRLQMTSLNTNALDINNAFTTIRGVRLCQY